jgi:hypothetical protein
MPALTLWRRPRVWHGSLRNLGSLSSLSRSTRLDHLSGSSLDRLGSSARFSGSACLLQVL